MKKALSILIYILCVINLLVFVFVLFLAIKDAMETNGTYYSPGNPNAHNWEIGYVTSSILIITLWGCPIYLNVIPQILFISRFQKWRDKLFPLLIFFFINIIGLLWTVWINYFSTVMPK